MLVLWQWTTGLWAFASVLERWWDTSALWRGLNPQTPSAHAWCPTSATAPVSWILSSRAPPLCLFLLGPGPPFLSLHPLHLQPRLARFPQPLAGIWFPMPPPPCWATLHRPCEWDLWAPRGRYWIQRWSRFVDCLLSPDIPHRLQQHSPDGPIIPPSSSNSSPPQISFRPFAPQGSPAPGHRGLGSSSKPGQAWGTEIGAFWIRSFKFMAIWKKKKYWSFMTTFKRNYKQFIEQFKFKCLFFSVPSTIPTPIAFKVSGKWYKCCHWGITL